MDRTIDLSQRTKQFALRIIKMYCSLPRRGEAEVMGKQVLRSGTSPGAQYREALRSRSSKEFVSKMESALQELEETRYWLELLVESGTIAGLHMDLLMRENSELIAIFVSSIKTAKGKN